MKHYEQLLTKRRPWEPQWRELATYLFPRRLASLEVRTPGARQTERLFDSTAIFANEILSAAIQSGITNQAIQWFTLALRNEDLNEDHETAIWLEAATKKMLLAFRQSNLASELHESYLDLGAFGVSAMLMEPHPRGGLLFRTIPVGEFLIDENAEGMVDTVFYEFKMSLRAAIDKYGIEKFDKKLQEKLKKEPYSELTLIHAVYKRPDDQKTKVGQRSWPYASCVIEKEHKSLLMESGYPEFPFAVPRWTKASGEVYGRSPGHTALPDVKTLNKAIELELRAWAKVIDPPLKSTRNSIIGDVELSPGGLTILRNIEDLKELTTNPRFDISDMKKEEIKMSIKNIFFVEQMLQLMSRDTPQMTATEVQVKVQLLQQILGPTFGRLETELLNPLLDRTFAIMMRNNAFGEVPETLRGTNLEIEYEGPLARAQRTQQLLAVERSLTLLAGMVGIDPEVADNFDLDQMLRDGAEISGVPKTHLRSVEDRDARRQVRAQQKAQEQEALRLQSLAEAAGKAAPAVTALGDIAAQREGGSPGAIPPIS